jgi:PKD repeat protein
MLLEYLLHSIHWPIPTLLWLSTPLILAQQVPLGSPSTCAAIDPNWQSYSVYFVTNPTGGPYEYNGRTIALPATIPVICGETYHIKLAIADIGDGSLDSGVFLEAGSFSSNGISATSAIVPSDIFLCDPNAPLSIDVSAGSNPPQYSFWDFGDGLGTSTDHDLTYVYSDTGTYVVMYVGDRQYW